MDLLGVLKRYIEAIEAHEPRVEKFVDLEGEESTEDHNRPGMALVGLLELLIPLIFTENHQEEKAEDEVAEELED